jgi:nucleoside-diphosphate-sugar epimerase
MKIAILGATSQIAKDLILSFSPDDNYDLILFARQPDSVSNWLSIVGLNKKYPAYDFNAFIVGEYFDAIINFIGTSDPAKSADIGSSILDVTLKYDQMVMRYIQQHPNCRYIFLSSGAVYNSKFDKPADRNTEAIIAINDIQPQYWYGIAKLFAECRHRSFSHLPIVDVRIFNYFSHTLDISTSFLIADIVRSIEFGDVLITSPENIIRDYIGPDDFFQMILSILLATATNDVIDCYTKDPVDKMTLLTIIEEKYGLVYLIEEKTRTINATGSKRNYYSTNYRAERFGYKPQNSSMENILSEMDKILNTYII